MLELPLPFTWGEPTLFRLGTTPPETFPVRAAPAGATCPLEFGRELVCELRPHGPELDGAWRFGLHQLLDVPAAAAAMVRYELRLFVYKPAGAEVTVQLKTTREVQLLRLGPPALAEGEQQLILTAPLTLAHGGLPLWLDVRASRAANTGQVLVTVDALTLTLA